MSNNLIFTLSLVYYKSIYIDKYFVHFFEKYRYFKGMRKERDFFKIFLEK